MVLNDYTRTMNDSYKRLHDHTEKVFFYVLHGTINDLSMVTKTIDPGQYFYP